MKKLCLFIDSPHETMQQLSSQMENNSLCQEEDDVLLPAGMGGRECRSCIFHLNYFGRLRQYVKKTHR